MRNSKLTMTVILMASAASACSSTAAQTPPVTRVATQTPWIIYVPVTSTSEPATVTPLPTVTSAGPLRTPTKAAVKPPAIVPTKSPVPVVAAPTNSPAPACNLGTVGSPFFPEDGAPRNTRADGSGGAAIIFKWQPPTPLSGQGDPSVGYMVQIDSKRAGQHINGAIAYVSSKKYLLDGQFVLPSRAVSSLASGDNATVTWNVTIVRTSGSFNDNDYAVPPPGLINCGSPSQNMIVQLLVNQ